MNKFRITLLMVIALISITSCLYCEEDKLVSPKVIPVTTVQAEENRIYPIAIVGAGAAGTMAAKRATLNNNQVLLFTGAKQERRRSRGNWVRKVDNIPGLEKYKRTVLELRNEALTNIVNGPMNHNLFIIEDSIITIEKEDGIFKLIDISGRIYLAKYVIMATGMMDGQPHIQDSIRPILPYANGQTVAYCLLCDGHRSFQKNTVVIGYGEDAAIAASLITDRYHPLNVTILTNGNKPQFYQETFTLLKDRQISVVEEPIYEVLGNQELKQLKGFRLQSGEVINADMGFVFLGIRPNNELVLQLGANVDSRGLVVTDEKGESSIPNLFIAGDLRSNSMKQIYTAWQHAVDVTQTINRRIRSE